MKYFVIFLIIIGFAGTAYAIHDDQTSRGVDDPKITVSDSGVYVVWGEGSGQNTLDLLFAKSTDGGKTFDETINLTNGMSFFPDPKITVSGDNVYVVWEDSISEDGIDSIFFTKSDDGGQTFDEPRILDPVDDSYNLIYRPIEVIESNDVLYVFASYWERETKQHQMIFLTSSDNGDTFSSPTVLFDDGQWDDYIDFEVNNGIIYVLTDDKKNYDELGDLNLRKIFADGSLSDIISVNGGNTAASTAQLAVSGDNVYVAWRAWENERWNLAFTKSSDRGDTFTKPQILNSDPTSTDIHSSEGSNIFAYGDSVYVKWREVYWDGENQSFKTWTATSHDSGKDFGVEVHPLDKLLGKYGMILSVQEGENLYSMAMTTKNPPFDDGAIYFARSNDGKSYTEPVDVLANNPPEFRLPDVATHGNSIHMVAEGNRESSCVMYASSYDNGVSFETKNLSSNGNPKQCLGIEEQISAPLHQMRSGVDIEDIRCKDDRLKGYVLALRDGQPVCVTAASYDTMLKRGIISDESFEVIALNAARDYLLSHPQISSSIVGDSLELDIYMTRHSIPPAFIIQGTFDTTSPIYDDDTNPLNHTIDITLVQYNKIHKAQIDDKYELTKYDESSENRNPRDRTIVSPTVKTILSPGDRINNKGLIPLLITEVSQGGFDHTTHWTFQSIGYQADNKNKRWGFLPDQHRIHETVDEQGNDAIDRDRMPENFGVPLPLFIFPLLCGDERIEGESGWHYTLPTRTDTSTVYFRSTDKGIYPDENGIYDIQFVSMFKTEVELKPNFEVVSEQSVLCQMEGTSNDATHGYYTRLQFKIDDKISESYQSSDSADFEKTHQRATILVQIFGDKFNFDSSAFYLQNPQINIEPSEPTMIHRNSDEATLGFFFDTMGMELTGECFVFPDGREFCNDDENSLKFYVNDNKQDDISQYLINDDDRILISYGPETKDVTEQLEELESVAKYNYQTLEKLMTMDVGTVEDGTFDSDLGFRTAEKLFRIDMERQTAKHDLEYTLSQKQSAYDTMVRQDADQKTLESIQDEIKQIESQLDEMANTPDQYTTEGIFQRVDQIEAENILMHNIGPEEYDDLVLAKNSLEEQVKEQSIPLVSVQINPETAQLDVILSEGVEGDTAQMEQYRTIIDNMIPQDIPWTIIFSD